MQTGASEGKNGKMTDKMSELILCRQMLAALPYYMEEAAINIYSLEELSYYIGEHLYLMEEGFMNAELCTWIDKELGLKALAEELRGILKRRGTLAEFIAPILRESYYFSPAETQQIVAALAQQENRSAYERGKLKADRYVVSHRYVSAIYEYHRLLDQKEQDETLAGNVWHNLGKAYAGLFLFREAAFCFKSAYEQNQNPESLKECLYACRCMQDEEQFYELATESGFLETEIEELNRQMEEWSQSEELERFGEELDTWFEQNDTEAIGRQLMSWRTEYRKNVRL